MGWIGYTLLPWYAIYDGFWSFAWLDGYVHDGEYAPALFQGLLHDRAWLLPIMLPLLAPLAVVRRDRSEPAYARVLIAASSVGLGYIALQGFAVGISGWSFDGAAALWGLGDVRQFGMGYGALAVCASLLFLFSQGLAARGAVGGDIFVSGAVVLVVALVSLFIFFPITQILVSAFQDNDFNFAPGVFVEKLFSSKIWGLRCLTENVGCGVAWNSLQLAVLTGAGTTLLGLAFALLATRTGFRFRPLLRVLSVLPIITPPFVIGLAIILLFGVSGTITQLLEWAFDVPPSRYIYGLPGIWFAQMLAYTPIAFMVLIGVVEGVSPSVEEAAQTLRADRWKTFTSVSLPLMRPGLANAFLLGFIESLADFGNPLVLGGDYDVLSTEIFFAIVGAQYDQGRAAVLAIVLLSFSLSAFWAQRYWLGRKAYTTVTGKGDAGNHIALPRPVQWAVVGVTLPWAALTLVIYLMILFGGFVETWGRDHSFTLRHYVDAFGVSEGPHGLIWSGAAWNSFGTTLMIAALSAPLTAALGLLTAYLLVRHQFRAKSAFEFGTMMSFAIPGTVIGVSYILAFNVPPIELTGTGIILVICFLFRNMPVGVRAGIAAMSQLDKNLDEASLVLGARALATVRRVLLPLLRPAIVAALVYSFVRAMTAISAVIFLVSAEYDMATSYIIGRVENGDYGLAIAYCSVLILVMLASIVLVQLVVGERQLGRRSTARAGAPKALRSEGA